MAKTATALRAAAAYMARRRAAVRDAKAAALAAGETYVEPTLASVYAADNGVCYLCGRATSPHTAGHADHRDPRRPTIDHVVPLSCGGLHNLANTKLACWKCNRDKSDKLLGEVLSDRAALGA